LDAFGRLKHVAQAAKKASAKSVQTCLIYQNKTAGLPKRELAQERTRLAQEGTDMAIMMPVADEAVLARREAIVSALRAIVPGEGVIDGLEEMRVYESDGLTAYRQPPMVVVLPDTTEQVSKVLKYCHEQGIKVVPRGSGTSLSGGALPL